MRRNRAYIAFSLLLLVGLIGASLSLYRHPSQVEARLERALESAGLDSGSLDLILTGGRWNDSGTSSLERLELRGSPESEPLLVLEQVLFRDGEAHAGRVPPWARRRVFRGIEGQRPAETPVDRVLEVEKLTVRLNRGEVSPSGEAGGWNFDPLLGTGRESPGGAPDPGAGAFYLRAREFGLTLDLASPPGGPGDHDPAPRQFRGRDLEVAGGGRPRTVLARGSVEAGERHGPGKFELELAAGERLRRLSLELQRVDPAGQLDVLPPGFRSLTRTLRMRGVGDLELEWTGSPGPDELTGQIRYFDGALVVPGTALEIPGLSGRVSLLEEEAHFGSTSDRLRTPLRGSLASSEVHLRGQLEVGSGTLGLGLPHFHLRRLASLLEGLVPAEGGDDNSVSGARLLLEALVRAEPAGEVALDWELEWEGVDSPSITRTSIRAETGDLVFPRLGLLRRGRGELEFHSGPRERSGTLHLRGCELAGLGSLRGELGLAIQGDEQLILTAGGDGLQLGLGARPGTLEGRLLLGLRSGTFEGEIGGSGIEFALGDDRLRATIARLSLRGDSPGRLRLELELEKIEMHTSIYAIPEELRRRAPDGTTPVDRQAFASGRAVLILGSSGVELERLVLLDEGLTLRLWGSLDHEGEIASLGGLVSGGEAASRLAGADSREELEALRDAGRSATRALVGEGALSAPRLRAVAPELLSIPGSRSTR